MAVWPLQDSNITTQGGAILATSARTLITTATVNVKTAWVEIIAATSYPSSSLYVVTSGMVAAPAATSGGLFDVAIGAAGSEIVVVADVQCGFLTSGAIANFFLPLRVPSGARISMRAQSSAVPKSMGVQIYLPTGGFVPMESSDRAVTYGALTASSGGTLLTTAGATNTKAAWTVITASTTAVARHMLVTLQPPDTATVTAGVGLVDIGVGAAAAEQVIISNMSYETTTAERIEYGPIVFPVSVPAGSRLTARYQCSTTTTGAVPRVTLTTFS